MEETQPVDTGKQQIKVEKKKPPKDTKFKPGVSGNPAGRPEGSKNFNTLFNEAIEIIAKDGNLKNPETEMIKKAVSEAVKGNYSYFKDIMDRRYGSAKKSLDITTGGNPLKSLMGEITDDKESIVKRREGTNEESKDSQVEIEQSILDKE